MPNHTAAPDSTRVVARIQAHPSRKDLRPALIDALVPLYVEVSEHSSIPPDPWAGYKQALSNLPDCTHVLVVQDDAQPVQHFAEAVGQIAETYPHTPVCLFLGALPSETARRSTQAVIKSDVRYISLGPASFVPLVCVLWPKAVAEHFLNWSRTRKTTRADDGNAAKWMRQTKQTFMVSVPSLVQHNDFVSSVKGGREHVPGAEKWRQALFLAEDALDYEW